jgi:deazaflavin-dependent oxidoreductase (nitroreductase family)
MHDKTVDSHYVKSGDTEEYREFRTLKNAASREHLLAYIATGGEQGYIMPHTKESGPGGVLHMVLKSVGRKTGKVRLLPLAYAPYADEYVIVASKSGHADHPAWFLNLTAQDEVEWQVLDKRFRGTWRVAEGEERKKIWDYITVYLPVFEFYQSRTAREMPVVVLTAKVRVGEEWVVPDDAYVDVKLT